MKKLLWLSMFVFCALGGDVVRRRSEPREIPQSHVYNSALTIQDGDITITINAQLETRVFSREKKIEINLKLWELDRHLATRRITVNW